MLEKFMEDNYDKIIQGMFQYSYNSPLKKAFEEAMKECQDEIKDMIKTSVKEIISTNDFWETIKDKIAEIALKKMAKWDW